MLRPTQRWVLGLTLLIGAGAWTPAQAYLADATEFPTNVFSLRVSDLVATYGLPSGIEGNIYSWRNKQATIIWSFGFTSPEGPMQQAAVGVVLPNLTTAEDVFAMWQRQAARETKSPRRKASESAGDITYIYKIPTGGAVYITIVRATRLVTYTISR